MDTGEWLTRGTIWLALTLYVAGEGIGASCRERGRTLARGLNSFGCGAFIAHVVCAFHFHHHWSHAAAYADTARQTLDYFGWNWGGGLYFNYAVLLLWLGYVVRTWALPDWPRASARWLAWTARGFVMLMIFNGAFIFARGPIRWYGLFLCLMLTFVWMRLIQRQQIFSRT